MVVVIHTHTTPSYTRQVKHTSTTRMNKIPLLPGRERFVTQLRLVAGVVASLCLLYTLYTLFHLTAFDVWYARHEPCTASNYRMHAQAPTPPLLDYLQCRECTPGVRSTHVCGECTKPTPATITVDEARMVCSPDVMRFRQSRVIERFLDSGHPLLTFLHCQDYQAWWCHHAAWTILTWLVEWQPLEVHPVAAVMAVAMVCLVWFTCWRAYKTWVWLVHDQAREHIKRHEENQSAAVLQGDNLLYAPPSSNEHKEE